MSLYVGRDRHVYEFGTATEPAAEVDPGETLTLDVLDAAGGRIHDIEEAKNLPLAIERSNPATGPVAIRGAAPGDTLAVEILEINLGRMALGFIRAGSGVIIDELDPPEARCPEIIDGVIRFDDRISFPAKPMIGVIGVAPAAGSIHTFHPGAHGGNLDVSAIEVGATVYLPVSVPGAYLALGDVHARMGEGELTGGGLDIDAEVTVRVDLRQGLGWKYPVVETADAWCTCGHGSDLAEAVRQATRAMVDLMTTALDLTPELAFILVGAAGDARLGQAAEISGVDATAWLRMPKEILRNCGGG